MAVLMSNECRSILDDFISRSCQVFEKLDVRTSTQSALLTRIPGSSLRLMFLYIKASIQNSADLVKHGLDLPKNVQYFSKKLGADHPHAHSARLLWAWHLVGRKEYHQALKLLYQCLEDTRRSTIIWKFYEYNIRGLIAQVHAARGEHKLAISFFAQALLSLDSWPSVRPHHETLILDRELQLAHSLAQCDERDLAMIKFEKVIKGFVRRFTYQNGKTWHAIRQYSYQLEAWGLADDARALREFHDMRHHMEHLRETGWGLVEHLPDEYRNATTPTFVNADLQRQTVQEVVGEALLRKVD
jgi:tetratricopeptide (TPR) repeat protein